MILRLLNATRYSLQGIAHAFKKEPAFRLECLVLALAFPLAFIATPDVIERLLLISSVLLLVIVELVNTGIERLADEISTKKRKRLGQAKDAGSAAVFVCALLVCAVWISIVWY